MSARTLSVSAWCVRKLCVSENTYSYARPHTHIDFRLIQSDTSVTTQLIFRPFQSRRVFLNCDESEPDTDSEVRYPLLSRGCAVSAAPHLFLSVVWQRRNSYFEPCRNHVQFNGVAVLLRCRWRCWHVRRPGSPVSYYAACIEHSLSHPGEVWILNP